MASWTWKQSKQFELALEQYGQDWPKVARAVGDGKSAEEVKRYYEWLLEDVNSIESGHVAYPNYRSSGRGVSTAVEEQRLGGLNLQ